MKAFLQVLLVVSLALGLGFLLTWGCVGVMQDITKTIEAGLVAMHPGLGQ